MTTIHTANKISSPTYSIEFAHIYTDERVNGNHLESGKILNQLNDLKETANSTSVVLIDNYNAEEDGFSTKNFLEALADIGARPDFYVFEADLVPFAEDFLQTIEKPKIARLYRSYIERKGIYPCSLLTATWYLIRLGYIEAPEVFHSNNSQLAPRRAVANRIINILPASFRDIEKDAHRLIGHSSFKEARYKIQPILFEEKAPVREGFVPEIIGQL